VKKRRGVTFTKYYVEKKRIKAVRPTFVVIVVGPKTERRGREAESKN
jgi:hypothetical protein